MKNLCTIGLAVLMASHASAMDGQATGRIHSVAQVLPSANAQAEKQTDIVREIDDPHTGDRWMLVRDPLHPGGPGSLYCADVNGTRHGRWQSRPGACARKRSN